MSRVSFSVRYWEGNSHDVCFSDIRELDNYTELLIIDMRRVPPQVGNDGLEAKV